MSDNNFKDYDLDNFDDTSPFGRHFKEDEEPVDRSYNLEDFETAVKEREKPQQEPQTPDYGDDFYAEGNSFEPDASDDDEEFQPVITRKSYSRTAKLPNKNKNKSIAIIVIAITVALIIFLFSLLFFIGSKIDSKKSNETKATTVATQTIETKQTEEKTEEQTQEQTQAPTQAPTEPPTEPPTEAPTEPVYEEPTSDDSGYYEEPTVEEFV